jgi:hypothetical protein
MLPCAVHADECNYIIEKATPKLERSGVSDAETGKVSMCVFVFVLSCLTASMPH